MKTGPHAQHATPGSTIHHQTNKCTRPIPGIRTAKYQTAIMHRFYLPSDQCVGAELSLTGPEAHHALHVVRVKPGERVTVLDGCGTCITCEVKQRERNSIKLAVLNRDSIEPPQYRITLVQAVPKAKAFECIIQKATELGAWRIVPLTTIRTTPELHPENLAHKLAKWQRIAIEAIKQSANPWLPKIESPVRLNDFVSRDEKFDLKLVAALLPNAMHPRESIVQFIKQHRRQPTNLCVWIGPEGDFAPDELDAIIASGALPITLGPHVLRAETAAICCLAILHNELTAPDHCHNSA